MTTEADLNDAFPRTRALNDHERIDISDERLRAALSRLPAPGSRPRPGSASCSRSCSTESSSATIAPLVREVEGAALGAHHEPLTGRPILLALHALGFLHQGFGLVESP
jgi:hypothetical protein